MSGLSNGTGTARRGAAGGLIADGKAQMGKSGISVQALRKSFGD